MSKGVALTAVEQRYALLGFPVQHSLSPMIHRQFAKMQGMCVDYVSLPTIGRDFDRVLASFRQRGGMGCSITTPLKHLAWLRSASHTDQARRAASANCLRWCLRSAAWQAHNTDGQGLVDDITQRIGASLQGKRVLICGIGSATRAIVPALHQAGVASIHLLGRDPGRLADCLAHCRQVGVAVDGHVFSEHPQLVVDWVINASASTLQQTDLPPLQVQWPDVQHAYDLSYGQPSSFLSSMAQAGVAQCHDGLGMLVYQAAHQWHWWHGVMPVVQPVYQQCLAYCA